MTQKSYLRWLDDERIGAIVTQVYERFTSSAQKRAHLAGLQANIIDPFAFAFEAGFSNVDLDTWLAQEMARQVQKSFQNALGDFHEMVLGSCNGWVQLEQGAGADIKREDNSIWAEIKNKFNTTKGNDLKHRWHELETVAEQYPQSTCYYVAIITRNSINEVWKLSGLSHPRIRNISGDRFYALVTGYDDALLELHRALPRIIQDVKSAQGGSIEVYVSNLREEMKTTLGIDDLRFEAAFNKAHDYLFRSAFPFLGDSK